jgi:hypothetical protein
MNLHRRSLRNVRAHSRPFEHHLQDAIALNRERAPRYAALSSGTSRPISRALIAAEWMLLPVARWFDRQAAPYHADGIPLLESVFVPMAGAPAFGSVQLVSDAEPSGPAPRPAAIRRRVRRAYRAAAFPGAASALAGELALLAPHGNWLVRHLLESAQHLATLAPDHIERCQERGLPSPVPLLARLLRLHLWGLAPAAALDRRARPLHARGVPILAQDLPPIPGPSPSP